MKKVPVLVNALLLSAGIFLFPTLAGCTKSEEIQSEKEQIPNPWITADSLSEAEEKTGISLDVPEEISGNSMEMIQYLSDPAEIQVFYGDDEQVLVRKARTQEDISGDYTEYPQIIEMPLSSDSSAEVTLKGKDSRYSLAIWTSGNDSCSIQLKDGLPQETLIELCREIR